MFTVGAVYNEFGGAIGESFDEERNAVEAAMKNVDDSLLQNVHEAVATNESLLGLETDVKDLHTLTDDMAVVKAEYFARGLRLHLHFTDRLNRAGCLGSYQQVTDQGRCRNQCRPIVLSRLTCLTTSHR